MATVTRADLRTRIQARLDGNTELYPDPEVHAAIDDAVRALNLFTGFIQTTALHSAFTVANQHIYDVPSGYLFLVRVEFQGRVLDKTSLSNICNSNPEWLSETTANTGIPVSSWVPLGVNKFAIHPADSLGSQNVRLAGVVEPTSLSADDSVIAIPDDFSDLIEDLASHYLQMKEGGIIFTRASLLYQKFLGKMKELTRFTTMKNPTYWVDIERPN